MFLSFLIVYSFGITSSNAVLYIIKERDGGISIKNDLTFDEADRLIFMFAAGCVVKWLEQIASAVTSDAIIETTWNSEEGEGIIKEFRPDGTEFIVVLSRYVSDQGDRPRGLFIGGDLPYGDSDNWHARGRNNTGIAFYDGHNWRHIWCSINEGMTINGMDYLTIYPSVWTYQGSKLLKKTMSEIMIESYHELSLIDSNNLPVQLSMKRRLYKKAGEDYILFKVEFTNKGKLPVQYNYLFGDEPWVGDFGNSDGDIGWSDRGVYKTHIYLLPSRIRFAGIWDRGNDLIGERQTFSNFANFIEWLDNPPTFVQFSDDFRSVHENQPLSSKFNRIVNLQWLYQVLMPGESKGYTFAMGMARPDSKGTPLKPEVAGRY